MSGRNPLVSRASLHIWSLFRFGLIGPSACLHACPSGLPARGRHHSTILLLAALFAVPLLAQTPVPEGPSQLYGIGAGITGLGPAQVSGEYFIATRIGQGTYAATITDFQRMKGGSVGTSARGAIYKTLWRFNSLSIGASGEAGAAEGATGSASGAVGYSGYLHFRIGKTPFGIIGTARVVKIAGAEGQQGQVRLGITFGTYSDSGPGKP